ncbi:hypothetical protein ACHAWF_008627 [Thalassiosira exigua]
MDRAQSLLSARAVRCAARYPIAAVDVYGDDCGTSYFPPLEREEGEDDDETAAMMKAREKVQKGSLVRSVGVSEGGGGSGVVLKKDVQGREAIPDQGGRDGSGLGRRVGRRNGERRGGGLHNRPQPPAPPRRLAAHEPQRRGQVRLRLVPPGAGRRIAFPGHRPRGFFLLVDADDDQHGRELRGEGGRLRPRRVSATIALQEEGETNADGRSSRRGGRDGPGRFTYILRTDFGESGKGDGTLRFAPRPSTPSSMAKRSARFDVARAIEADCEASEQRVLVLLH